MQSATNLNPNYQELPEGFFCGRDYSETRIVGTISRLFKSSESFSAGIISATGGDPLAKDCRFMVRDCVSLGEKITFHGAWEENKYGKQFVATNIEYPAPDTSPEGLAHYLATQSEFKGLGPAKAKMLADKFGNDFDRAIREDLDSIAEAGKLTPEQAETLRDIWIERQDVNAISMWLGSYGLTSGQVRKIAKEFGNSARAILTENPYILHKSIAGIGFLRNDEIALNMGVSPMCDMRIQAGLVYYCNEAHENSGHTYIPKGELIASIIKNLYLDDINAGDCVRANIDKLADETDKTRNGKSWLKIVNHNGAEYVGTTSLYNDELYVFDCLRTPTEKGIALVDISSVDPAEVGLDTLTDEQREAVANALNNPVLVITGGAGVGKSHTIKRIVATLKTLEKDTLIAAPTGKAARRLQADGVDATTIHRMLEYNPFLGGFTYGLDQKLDVACIIIDEASMIAVPLFADLCRAIDFKRTRLIIVGDYNQLPPIGAGNTLRDFVDNKLVPISRFTKCHRNAGKLKENCIEVLSGTLNRQGALIDASANRADIKLQTLHPAAPAWQVLSDCNDTQRVIEFLRALQSRQFALWGFDPLTDCQIITPQRPGPLGVNRLNLELQRVEQAKRNLQLPEIADSNAMPIFYIGDKVMQTKNDYARNLMNGTQGVIMDIIQDVDPENAKTKDKDKIYDWLSIQFDDRENGALLKIRKDNNSLVLGYAVTCHKVQGSQYPCVVSIVHRTHSYMLNRNLLYTAVSRARYTSIILGETRGMTAAAQKITNMDRRTWTSLFAQEVTSNV